MCSHHTLQAGRREEGRGAATRSPPPRLCKCGRYILIVAFFIVFQLVHVIHAIPIGVKADDDNFFSL